MLRAYSRLCTQGSLLAGSRILLTEYLSGMEPGPATCAASVLTAAKTPRLYSHILKSNHTGWELSSIGLALQSSRLESDAYASCQGSFLVQVGMNSFKIKSQHKNLQWGTQRCEGYLSGILLRIGLKRKFLAREIAWR